MKEERPVFMKTIFSTLLSLSLLALWADGPSVSGVTVRQRWPWSPVIDVDYTLNASEPCLVSFSCSGDGIDGGLMTNGVGEAVMTARPGANHFTFDPEAAGLGGMAIANFRVTPSAPQPVSARTYLVFDLKERSYAYHADDPDGGKWADEKYKKRYVVFRRVPAGTYRVGLTPEQQARWEALGAPSATDAYRAAVAAKDVTITADYYIGLFMVTHAQATAIEKMSSVNWWPEGYMDSIQPAKRTSAGWRGDETAAANRCTWPQDGHRVVMPGADGGGGSLIGHFRRLMEQGAQNLPDGMVIDLPTAAQYEIAARGGQTTLYDGCGTLTDDLQTIEAYQKAHYAAANVNVGTLAPSGWNLYDTAGISHELVLDRVSSDSDKSEIGFEWVNKETVDPIGETCADLTKLYMVMKSYGWTCHGATYLALPSHTFAFSPRRADAVFTARLCVHMKPLVR